MLDKLRENHFDIQFESHAAAILEHDFPAALEDIERVLLNVKIPIAEIIGSGGGGLRQRKGFGALCTTAAGEKRIFYIGD